MSLRDSRVPGKDFIEESSDGSNVVDVVVKDSVATLTQGLLDSNGDPKVTPTTAKQKYANDVNAPTGAASADAAELTAVIAADVVERSFVTGDVDGVTVECHGGAGFAGVYVTLASSDIGTAAAASRLTGANDNSDHDRVFIAKDSSSFIPFPGLTHIFMVAMDVDGTEENHVNLVPA